MILPFVYEELEESENDVTEETEGQDLLPREYGVNFETGELTGKVVEGVDAVKVWAWQALQTPRNRYYIYSIGYGHDFETLIGRGYSDAFIRTELKRLVENCLSHNSYITGIENFQCEIVGDQVKATFTIITDFGESEVDISV